jgi:hypothetical protein
LRRLAEGAAHPLRIANAGGFGNPLDRFAGELPRCRASTIRPRRPSYEAKMAIAPIV